MSLVASFTTLLQPLALAMTPPSYHNAVMLLTGWAFAPKRTVTNMIAAAGVVRDMHFSASPNTRRGASRRRTFAEERRSPLSVADVRRWSPR